MKPNKDDLSFAAAVKDDSQLDALLARIITQRLVFFIVGGIHLALLMFNMLAGGNSTIEARSHIPTVVLGLNAALFAALGLHADAKLKTLIILKELKEEK